MLKVLPVLFIKCTFNFLCTHQQQQHLAIHKHVHMNLIKFYKLFKLPKKKMCFLLFACDVEWAAQICF